MTNYISEKIDPHSLKSSKLKAFWALEQLERLGGDRFSPQQIANYLVDNYRIDISRQAIYEGLKSSKKAINKNKYGYKLMECGRKQLEDSIMVANSAVDGIVLIEHGKPFSAKNVLLKQIFDSLVGSVCISDPYIDLNTLDLIFRNLKSNVPIRFLTSNIIDKPAGIFGRQLLNLRKEDFQIEVGIYSKSELHDRYFFDEKNFWLSGNSLNHLGEKESFLVSLGPDIRQSVLSTFNSRWKVSAKI